MTAADKIRARVAELEGIRDRYLAYQQDRVNERDHHGAWDVAVNLSETECEIAGLRFALDAIAGEAMWEAGQRAAQACGQMPGTGGACVLPWGHKGRHQTGPRLTTETRASTETLADYMTPKELEKLRAKLRGSVPRRKSRP